MKKILSVLNFLAERTLWKILIMIVVFSALQIFMFTRRLSSSPQGVYNLWRGFYAWFYYMIAAALIILSGSSSKHSRYEYRLRLLRVSERGFFHLSTLYNAVVFILIWLAESAVLSIAVRIYENSAAFSGSPQEIFAELGISANHQMFILLDDKMVFISTIMAMIAFGDISGMVQIRRKAGKISIFAIVLYAAYFILTSVSVSGNGYNQEGTYIIMVSCGILLFSVIGFLYLLNANCIGYIAEVDDGY